MGTTLVAGGYVYCVFGVAAVHCTAHATRERRHFGSHRELPAGARFYKANTFNSTKGCSFSPLSFPHVGFGVINAERFDLDKNLTWLGLRIRKVFNR